VILDILTRWFLHIGRRNPPRLGDITCFEADAARQAARYDADQQAMQRRRPPDDAWLRQA
jgi:hypothetical protein